MNLADIVAVGLAGGIGAATRLVIDTLVRARLARDAIPFGTIFINVSGSFLLGILTGLVLFHGAPSKLTVVAGAGFCGGYTTFSTASFETVRLLQSGRYRAAALHGVATVVGSLAAAGLGLVIAAR